MPSDVVVHFMYSGIGFILGLSIGFLKWGRPNARED